MQVDLSTMLRYQGEINIKNQKNVNKYYRKFLNVKFELWKRNEQKSFKEHNKAIIENYRALEDKALSNVTITTNYRKF